MNSKHLATKLSAILGAAALTASVAFSSSAFAESPGRDGLAQARYSFTTLSYQNNGQSDPRFTQLLGINDHKLIAGYHGDENTEMTPNRGFTLKLPGSFTDENFTNSVQTQVVGINNSADTVGFYIDTAGTNHGFFKEEGKDPVSVDLPGTTFNQLLGINNKDQAAGYFQDTASPAPLQHAYVHEKNGDFRVLGNLPMPSSQATGINDRGDVVGFLQQSTADTKSEGFLLKADGKLEVLNVPGSSFTQALGVSNDDDVVGQFTDGTGTHGFLYKDGQFQQIDVQGASSTTINGINNHDQIVGFFMDANGNTIGAVGEKKSS